MLAVGEDGSLWAWGDNSYGQLGDGTYVSKSAPVRIGNGKDWIDASAGNHFSIGIKKDGSLWIWGADLSSGNGHNSTSMRDQLTPLRYGKDNNWVKISVGNSGGAALKQDGTIVTFGLLNLGASIYGTKLNNDKDWADVSVGDDCLLAIKKNGSLWSIGSCVRGGESTAGKLTRIGQDNDWKLAAAGYYAVAVKKDGTVYELWMNRETNKAEEQPLLEMNAAVYVSGGFVATIVTDEGKVWEWDTIFDRYMEIGANGIEMIAADGGGTGVAISKDGVLYTYGSNSWGQRGNGQSDSIYRPTRSAETFRSQVKVDDATYTLHNDGTIEMRDWHTQEQSFPGSDWAFIAAGRDDLYAIKQDGSLWNYESSIYVGSYTYRPNEDYRLHPLMEGSKWRSVQASELGFVVGLKSDGTLWVWGRDAWGYLLKGYTDLEDYFEPAQMGIDKNWKSFSVSDDHILAIKEDGSLWGIGDNRMAQIASTLKPQVNAFSRIGSMKDWTQVQTSSYTTFGIRKDGTLWQWGRGLGSQNSNQKMTQVTKDKDWTKIWTRDNQAFALKKDGSLWSWGDNYFGELGTGAANSQSVPTRVADNGPWTTIFPQDYYTIGVKKDGSIWKWGNDSDSISSISSKEDLEMTPVVTGVIMTGGNGFATSE
ncbi:hypothetical protein PCCS19_10700 [Paenibacillus sp. CCS19]|nr:hypothetical protein PCCS19_10700 [Paenibacillus cellulosilyticus]